jgi:cardiolipin synthase
MQLFEVLVEWFYIHWVTLIVVLHISLSLMTSLHVLLFKVNERTSVAWIGLIILSHLLGSLLYWLFGINRIIRLAQKKHPKILKQDFLNQQKLIEFYHLPNNRHSAIIA